MRITSALLNSYRSNRWGHINNTADVFEDLRLKPIYEHYIFRVLQIIVLNVLAWFILRSTGN